MQYETYNPNNELNAFVKCFWTLVNEKENKPVRQTIVPDGCFEMIFHFGELYKQYLENGNSIIQPRCFVIGQITRPLEIEATGETNIFSVRFHPNGFIPFTTIPIKDFENTAIQLSDIYGDRGNQLEMKMLLTNSISERIQLIERFLKELLTDSKTIDRIVNSTVETILTADGKLSIDELSKMTNINRRQLERKFSEKIGLSPKQLSKTIRLQATLKILLNKQVTSLTSLAYHGEYYDQAHFIKDFKELTGFTPKEIYGHHLKMTSFFIID